MEEYTPQQIKQWSRELFDPKTPKKKLERIVMTLAHIQQPELLNVLEEFQKSSRSDEVKWIDQAIEECIFGLLSPNTDRQEKDYIRVELWQQYEDELTEMEGKLEAAKTKKNQLLVEKEFLENIHVKTSDEKSKIAVISRLSGIGNRIKLEDKNIYNLGHQIKGQEFLIEQIEKAVESPLYRKYGKNHIGVDIRRNCEAWMHDHEDEELPF